MGDFDEPNYGSRHFFGMGSSARQGEGLRVDLAE